MEHLHGTYSFPLVFLSIAISVLSSYCALDLFMRLLSLSGREHAVWKVFASMAMGLGIWSMHFIGMLAFHLPVKVRYDHLMVGVSMVFPILAAGAALSVITRSSVSRLRLTIAGVFMSLAIAAMHYSGMAAIRFAGTVSYDLYLVALSVLISFVISFALLHLSFVFRRSVRKFTFTKKCGASVVLGIAIAGMHYIGMEGADFHTYDYVPEPISGVLGMDEMLLAGLLGGTTLFILLLIMTSQHFDRRYALRLADLNRQRYDSIFEHNPDMVCLFDLKGRLIRTNPATDRITGYDRELFLSRPFTSFLTPGDILKVRQCFAQVLQGIPQTLECTIRHRNGNPVHLSTTIVPLLSGGNMVDIYTISKDITDQKHAEQQLLHAKKEAEQLARVKTEFLAVMSHEIRTPLNGVIGMTGILLETELNEEQQEYVGIIGKSGKALLNVINDLLDFSKIESGKMHLQNELFAITECLEETLQLFTPQMQQRQLTVSRHVDASLPTLFIGDAGRLRQVLINLIGNAVKFTERGEIEVRFRKLNQDGDLLTIECTVRDSGIGIPKDYMPYLFEPFNQLNTSIGRKHGGTGLGLAISKKLVEMMGGTIRAESTEGQGATFTFTFQVIGSEEPIAVQL